MPWSTYQDMPDDLLEAQLWEVHRQRMEEHKAMFGEQTLKTPELNKLRRSYLEIYQEIAVAATSGVDSHVG